VDVIVVGGGPAGLAAAIASARAGAQTVLVERFGYLGVSRKRPLKAIHQKNNGIALLDGGDGLGHCCEIVGD